MLKYPSEQEIFNFTYSTHANDKVPLTMNEISATWQQQGIPNPYAQGHFRAFMYVIHNLLPSNDFPAKSSQLLQNSQDSDTALFWLRDIHHKMADPFVNNHMIAQDQNTPNSFTIARYRITPSMAVTKPCPPVELIPGIMHNWVKEYSMFHEKVKDNLENPYGFSREEAYEIVKKAYNVNLFFCCVQPLACLNQRMGRFLEMTFRTLWRLPMKYYAQNSPEKERLPRDLEDFERESMPKILSASRDVR